MSKTRKIIDVVVLIFMLLFCSYFLLRRFIPRTIVVPDDYEKIGNAVSKAKSGDTVFVRAGTYNEWFKFKNGIKLIGEGKDKTIIKCPERPVHIILVVDCNSGLISNLSIQHGGQYGAKPAVMPICLANSSIEVSNCKISKASSSGIFITHGGSPVIHDCVIESNPSGGILVQGEHTSPIIRNNICRLNKEYGINFNCGAKGKIEVNTCSQNEYGIIVGDVGTNVSVTGNNCLSNEYGIFLWRGACVTLEDNVCDKNKKFGISITEEGTDVTLRRNNCNKNGSCGINASFGCKGVIEENTCEENESGIGLLRIEKPIYVRNNTCRANYLDGMTFCYCDAVVAENNICVDNDLHGITFIMSSKGIAEGNTCERNRYAGINIHGFGTKVTLNKNLCRSNYPSGIEFVNAATGKAIANICEKNPWSGIAIRGKGTDPDLMDNRCNDNGAWGIISWAGAKPVIDNNNVTLNNGREGIKRRD